MPSVFLVSDTHFGHAGVCRFTRNDGVTKTVPQIGTKFMKFCGKYDLKRISDNVQQYVDFLSAEYPV